MSFPFWGKDNYLITSVEFRFSKILFRVLGLLGLIISRKYPSRFSVLLFIHVPVAVKEVSGGSCCDTLINSNTVLDVYLETFSRHIQGPSDPLEYSLSAVQPYL